MPFFPHCFVGQQRQKPFLVFKLCHMPVSVPCLSLVGEVYQWDTESFDAFFLDFSCNYHPSNQKTCPYHCSRQFFAQCHRSGNFWLNSFPPKLFICLVSSCRTCSGLAWIFCHTQFLTACLIILILKCSNGATTGHSLCIPACSCHHLGVYMQVFVFFHACGEFFSSLLPTIPGCHYTYQ